MTDIQKCILFFDCFLKPFLKVIFDTDYKFALFLLLRHILGMQHFKSYSLLVLLLLKRCAKTREK